MALNRGQKYMVLAGVGLIVIVGGFVQGIRVASDLTSIPQVSVSRNSSEMNDGYSTLKPTAEEKDVIASMGSQFAVLKCPEGSDPTCAHIWHYEGGGQAWNFTFDMDGKLMKKEIVTPDSQ